MQETQPPHEPLQPADHPKNYHPPKPYWRRFHTHWGFWLAVVCLFAALMIYIFSYDLVLIPHKQPGAPTSSLIPPASSGQVAGPLVAGSRENPSKIEVKKIIR